MEKNLNPLAKTILNNLGKNARITYKLGSREEVVTSQILEITDSHLSVVIRHPEPFRNESINFMEYKNDGTYKVVGKLVTTQMIPINNILAFRIV
jgi:hypothetical protein